MGGGGGEGGGEEAFERGAKLLLESCAAAASSDPSLEYGLEAAKIMLGAGITPSMEAYSAMLRCSASVVASQASAVALAPGVAQAMRTMPAVRALHGCAGLVGRSAHLTFALKVVEQMEAAVRESPQAFPVAMLADDLEALLLAWLLLAGPTGAAASCLERLRALLTTGGGPLNAEDHTAVSQAATAVLEAYVDSAAGEGVILQGVQLVAALRRTLSRADDEALRQRLDAMTAHVITLVAGAAAAGLDLALQAIDLIEAHQLALDTDVANGLLVECGRLAAGGGSLAPSLSLLQDSVASGSDMAEAGGGELVLAASALAHPHTGAIGVAIRVLGVMQRAGAMVDSAAVAVVVQGAARLASGQGALKVASELCQVMAMPSDNDTPPLHHARKHGLALQVEAVAAACAHVSHGHTGLLRQALHLLRLYTSSDLAALDFNAPAGAASLPAAIESLLSSALVASRGEGAVMSCYQLLQLAETHGLAMDASTSDLILDSLSAAMASQRLPFASLSSSLSAAGAGPPAEGDVGDDDGMVGVGAWLAGEILSDVLQLPKEHVNPALFLKVAQIWMEDAANCRGQGGEGHGMGLVNMGPCYLDVMLRGQAIARAASPSSPLHRANSGPSGASVAGLMRGVCEAGKSADVSIDTCCRLVSLAARSGAAQNAEQGCISRMLHTVLDTASTAAVTPGVTMGLELVDVLRTHGSPVMELDKSVLTTLLFTAQTGCKHAGRVVKSGLSLLQAMPAAQITPDRNACDKLIRSAALSQNKTLTAAFQVLSLIPKGSAPMATSMPGGFGGGIGGGMIPTNPYFAAGRGIAGSTSGGATAFAPLTPKASDMRQPEREKMPKTPTPLLSATKALPRTQTQAQVPLSPSTRRALFPPGGGVGEGAGRGA